MLAVRIVSGRPGGDEGTDRVGGRADLRADFHGFKSNAPTTTRSPAPKGAGVHACSASAARKQGGGFAQGEQIIVDWVDHFRAPVHVEPRGVPQIAKRMQAKRGRGRAERQQREQQALPRA